MPQSFNLNARLNIQAPQNLRPVIQQIQGQLRGISATIDVRLSGAGAQQLAQLVTQANAATAGLRGLQGQARSTGSALASNASAASGAASAYAAYTAAVTGAVASTKAAAAAAHAGADATEAFGVAAGLAARRFSAYSLAAVTITGLILSIKNATGEAVHFEREMVKFLQVSGATRGELGELRNEITRVATGFGVSSSELVKVAVLFKQAGLSIDQTKRSLDAIGKSALLPSFDDMTKTAEGSIAVFRQFNIQAEQLEEVLSKINTVSARTATSSSDILDAIKRAGGAFRAAGGDIDQFIALFSTVRSTTRESSESIATGIRTIFTRVQRESTVEALRQLGVELRYTAKEAEALGNSKLANQFVGPLEAVTRLSTALSGLRSTDARFAGIEELLGGYRQVSKVVPLLQNLSDTQRNYTISLLGTVPAAAVAGQAQESLLVRTSQLRERFLALFRSLTETTTFRAFANTALNLANALVTLTDALKPVLPLLGTLASVRLGQAAFGLVAGGSGFLGGLARGATGQKFASGGFVVPGQGDTDSVSMTLPVGSYVLRKSSAKALGYAKGGSVSAMVMPGEVIFSPDEVRQIGLSRLNRMNRYAGGGEVGLSDTIGQVFANPTSTPRAGPRSIPFTGSRELAQIEAATGVKSDLEARLIASKFKLVGDVGTYRFDQGLAEDVFDKKVARDVINSINQALTAYLPPTFKGKANFGKDDGAVRSLKGFLFENFLSVLTRAPNQGGNSPFDFVPGKGIGNFAALTRPQATAHYLDAKLQQVTGSEILRKAASAGLWNFSPENVAFAKNQAKNIASLKQEGYAKEKAAIQNKYDIQSGLPVVHAATGGSLDRDPYSLLATGSRRLEHDRFQEYVGEASQAVGADLSSTFSSLLPLSRRHPYLLKRNAAGVFNWVTRRLAIAYDGKDPRSTLFHELGHAADASIVSRLGQDHPALRETALALYPHEKEDLQKRGLPQGFINYRLQPNELIANAFARTLTLGNEFHPDVSSVVRNKLFPLIRRNSEFPAASGLTVDRIRALGLNRAGLLREYQDMQRLGVFPTTLAERAANAYPLQTFARGGDVPALLQEGEYVFDRDSVNRLGGPNTLRRIQKYHGGGEVRRYANGSPDGVGVSYERFLARFAGDDTNLRRALVSQQARVFPKASAEELASNADKVYASIRQADVDRQNFADQAGAKSSQSQRFTEGARTARSNAEAASLVEQNAARTAAAKAQYLKDLPEPASGFSAQGRKDRDQLIKSFQDEAKAHQEEAKRIKESGEKAARAREDLAKKAADAAKSYRDQEATARQRSQVLVNDRKTYAPLGSPLVEAAFAKSGALVPPTSRLDTFKNRLSTYGPQAAFTLGALLPQLITHATGQISETNTAEQNRKAGFGESVSSGITGALSGAVAGGALGGFPGAVIGGAIGGLVAFTNTLKESDAKLKDIDIGRSVKNAIEAIDAENEGANSPALNQRATSGLRDSLAAIRERASKRFLESGAPASQFDTILKEETQRDFGSKAASLATNASAQIEALAKRAGGAPGNNLAVAAQAKSIVDDFAKSERGSLELSAISLTTGRSLEDLRKKLVDMASVTLRTTQATREQENATAKLNVAMFNLEAVTRAVRQASLATQPAQAHAGAFGATFEGQVAGQLPLPGTAEAIANIGGPNRQQAGNAINYVANSLGGAIGESFRQEANSIDALVRELPNIIDHVAGNNALKDEDSKANAIVKAASQIPGALPAHLTELRANISRVNAGRQGQGLEAVFKEGGEKVAHDLLKSSIEVVRNQGEAIAKALDEESQKLVAAAAQYQQNLRKIIGEEATLEKLKFDQLKNSTERLAELAGRPHSALDFISREQEQKPFLLQQERLSGLRGAEAVNPAALETRFNQLFGKSQAELTASGNATTKADRDTANERFIQFQAEAVRAKEALGRLADVSQRNAGIQERLARIDAERSDRLGLAEQVLKGGPLAAVRLNQGANLANIANQQGTAAFTPQAFDLLFHFLDSVKNVKLQGLGGVTGAEFKELVLRTDPRTKNLANLPANREKERDSLLNEVAKNLADAVEAQKRLIDVQTKLSTEQNQLLTGIGNANNDLLRRLGSAHESFLSGLKTNLNDAEINKTRAEQAFTESGSRGLEAQQKDFDVARQAGINDSNLSAFRSPQARQALTQYIAASNARNLVNSNFAKSLSTLRTGSLDELSGVKNAIEGGFLGEERFKFINPLVFSNLFEKFKGSGLSLSEEQQNKLQQRVSTRFYKEGGDLQLGGHDEALLFKDILTDELRRVLATTNGAALQNAHKGVSDATGLTGEALNRLLRNITAPDKASAINRVLDAGTLTFKELNDKVRSTTVLLEALNDKLNSLIGVAPLVQGQAAVGAAVGPVAIGRSMGGPVYLDGGGQLAFKPRGTDTIPAMLTPGEHVMRADVAARHRHLLDAMNHGIDPASFLFGTKLTVGRSSAHSPIGDDQTKGSWTFTTPVQYKAEGGEAKKNAFQKNVNDLRRLILQRHFGVLAGGLTGNDLAPAQVDNLLRNLKPNELQDVFQQARALGFLLQKPELLQKVNPAAPAGGAVGAVAGGFGGFIANTDPRIDYVRRLPPALQGTLVAAARVRQQQFSRYDDASLEELRGHFLKVVLPQARVMARRITARQNQLQGQLNLVTGGDGTVHLSQERQRQIGLEQFQLTAYAQFLNTLPQDKQAVLAMDKDQLAAAAKRVYAGPVLGEQELPQINGVQQNLQPRPAAPDTTPVRIGGGVRADKLVADFDAFRARRQSMRAAWLKNNPENASDLAGSFEFRSLGPGSDLLAEKPLPIGWQDYRRFRQAGASDDDIMYGRNGVPQPYGYAFGGVVAGTDKTLVRATPGEGILPVEAMKALGPVAFNSLRGLGSTAASVGGAALNAAGLTSAMNAFNTGASQFTQSVTIFSGNATTLAKAIESIPASIQFTGNVAHTVTMNGVNADSVAQAVTQALEQRVGDIVNERLKSLMGDKFREAGPI